MTIFGGPWTNSPAQWIAAAWVVWALSWLLAAAWSKPTAARASYAQQFPDRLVTLLGFVFLLGVARPLRFAPLWTLSEAAAWLCFAVVVAGIAFAWWARLHLGSFWSGTVQAKEGHRVVDTGPYAIVRHPIYTGMYLVASATAIARGSGDALLGAALIIVGFWMKARLEERFLAQELGEAAYAGYRARVPMLVPFLRF